MPPLTQADWLIEINNTRAAIAQILGDGQAIIAGGPGQGQHTQFANLREAKEYLQYCIENYERLDPGGNVGVNRVIFGRMS